MKYVIYRVDEGNRPDEVRFIKNDYGIYQGSNNPQLPKVGNNYKILYDNFDLAPIDETDANAKQHDLDYGKFNLSGFKGVLDVKSTSANKEYIKRAIKIMEKQKLGQKDDITKKPVTVDAAKNAKIGKLFFEFMEQMKSETNSLKDFKDDKIQKIPVK